MKENNRQLNRLSGRYEIIEQVGVGGMSYVYKAYDAKKKKIVAIKMLRDELSMDDEFVNKFKSEALACKDIRQKNVISAYDVIDEGNMHFIVMEYVEGTTLNKYIKSKGRLSNEETVNISLQVAMGIQAAHKKGIIHRDIKPQNIVIDNKKVVKITDFGIARAITSTTKNISVIGTVHYISPEQVRNTKVDFRSDIYSFGCSMYEMITGQEPFEGDTPLEIILSHLRTNLKLPHLVNDNIYPSLEKIIIKATRMVPRERYQTIEEMIKDLERALDDKEGTYIKDADYDADEEGKTVIISDEDMKVLKAVSQKYTNKPSYRSSDEVLTKEQQEFYQKYIVDGAFRHHIFMRRVIFASIVAVVLLLIIMVFTALDTRKKIDVADVATNSIVFNEVVKTIVGWDLDLAREVVGEYGVNINSVGEEYSDQYDYGKIIRIEKDNLDENKSLDIIVSKGSEVLDFTNKEALNETRWSEMLKRLKDRNLSFEVSEITDNNIPRGYIIGVNKKYSSDYGPLVFTVSRGISEQIKTMPSLVRKSVDEARDLLQANELVLGSISFVRNGGIPENHVISQSVNQGEEISAGSSVDLVLSCGIDGVEYIAEKKSKWHSELNTTYRVVNENSPNAGSNGTMVLQVRLMQTTTAGVVYTELIEAQEYKLGTIMPLMFTNIEGETGVQNGQVQVVDVENDRVLFSTNVLFWP